MPRKQTFFTFIAIAAGLTLALTTIEARFAPSTRLVRAEAAAHAVQLTAQAAEIPVASLPVDTAEAIPAAAPASAAPAADAVAISAPPVTFTGRTPVRVAPPRQLSATAPAVATDTGTWAVVVGINDYPGDANDLDFAVNDATDAVQALSMQGVDSDHILFLRDGQVTVPVLHSAVNWLVSHAGPDAVSVFFYAGHVAKPGNTQELVTSDGGRVPDFELARWFRPLAARRAWFTIAACYGGGFDELLGPGRVLTAAAGPNDVAYESGMFQRSYFDEYMIHRAMIEGAANATVQDAYSWAAAHLAQDYPDRQPFELDDSDGSISLRPAGASPSSPPPPPADPSSSSPDVNSSQPPDSGSQPPPDRCTGGFVHVC